MTNPPARSSVNSAAITGRLEVKPPDEPDSRLWFSDREIGAKRNSVALAYTADDFRKELRRVERKLYWFSFLSIALALVAVTAIVVVILQSGWVVA